LWPREREEPERATYRFSQGRSRRRAVYPASGLRIAGNRYADGTQPEGDPMPTHSERRQATSLGPFLTLVVLTASRRTTATYDRLANSETAHLEIGSELAEIKGSPGTHANTISLGPFLTLILTLRRGKESDSGPWRRSSFTWDAAPFVRIHASG